MLLAFAKYVYVRFCLLGLTILYVAVAEELYEGDPCKTKNSLAGICRRQSNCTEIMDAVNLGIMLPSDPVHCSYWKNEEVICCPISNSTVPGSRIGERPAVTACREIEASLSPSLTPHILDGTPVEVGEYPHMAALGYPPIGDEKSTAYEFRCGGALISNKFVLTAAHCVNSRESIPTIVRLGAADFKNAEQLKNAVDIQIKKTYIHDEFMDLQKRNDVALLELEREIPQSDDAIRPCCLNTDDDDPPPDANLFVTGWGIINATTRQLSTELLKAKLEIVPLQNCYREYKLAGRQLTKAHLCAHDSNHTKDSCQGDSGGPLNWVIDADVGRMKLVGIISSGFSCGSPQPGLYMRVSAYLDYIESIVWPN